MSYPRSAFILGALLLGLSVAACGGSGAGTGGGGAVAPTVTGIVPTGGPAAGSTPVTITGTGFSAGGVAVTIDGVLVLPTVVNDTTITATTPGGSGIGVAVVVSTAGGAAGVPGGYTYTEITASTAAGPLLPGSTTRLRIGDDFRVAISAVDVGGAASARLLNALPGMHFDPSVSGITPGSQLLRWRVSRHAAGRHRLHFVVPGSALAFSFDVRVYGRSDNTGQGTLIGDVTGDGIMDVVAGASSADGAAVDSGLIHVFAGGAVPAAAPIATLFVAGAIASDFLAGDAGAAPGTPGSGQLLQLADVTGDGILDIVAGAPYADIGVVDDGAVYVWAGGATLVGAIAPDATLVAGFGTAGDKLCGTMDGSQGLIIEEVTGDGILDIIAVAPDFDSVAMDAGAIFLWPGGPGLVGAVVVSGSGLAADAGVGGTAGAFLGRANPFGPGTGDGQLVQVADVTGDGVNDIVAGAILDDVAAVDSGAVFVWAGGPGILNFPSPSASLFDPLAAATDFLGHIADDGSLHLADVTGDGTLDVVVGATFADVTVANEGAIYVWAGGPGLSVGASPAATAICADPAAVGGEFIGFGRALTAMDGPQRGLDIGDVTGDGIPDIVACASLASVAAAGSGSVYVFAGGATLTGATAPTAIGSDPFAAAGDNMGSSFRSGSSVNLVDVTGDGINDIVVPGPSADLVNVDDGVIFVFAGGATLAGAVSPDAYLGNPLTGGDQVGRVNHAALLGNGHALHFEDVTGDGIRDVIAASPHVDVLAADDGAIYLWNGGAAFTGGAGIFPSATFSVAGTSDFGAADLSTFGSWMGGEGGVQIVDVTGDGILDITVNEPVGTHLGMALAGVTHVWAGGPAIPAAPAPTASLGGGAAGDGLGAGSGWSTVFADITGDGIDDVLFAGPEGFAATVPPGGHVFFWVGGAGIVGVPAPTAVLFDAAVPFSSSGVGSSYLFDGFNAQELFAADITGDGLCDVVGADGLHSRSAGGFPGSGEGAIHLWAGPAPVPAPTTTFLDAAAVPGDQLGRVK